jgi:hypothetical protein
MQLVNALNPHARLRTMSHMDRSYSRPSPSAFAAARPTCQPLVPATIQIQRCPLQQQSQQ